MTSMKIVQISRPPPPMSSYVQNSSTPLTLDVQFQTRPYLQMITNQLKGNMNLRWLLYVIRSFLQIGFRFQYQLINLVWLSFDFFSFRWSQYRPQSSFLKIKTLFSPFSYIEKMRWSQVWAEASLSAFWWLYIFVCAVKISRNVFSEKFFLMLILQSACFVCITWKRKQTMEQNHTGHVNERNQTKAKNKVTSYSIWLRVLLFDLAHNNAMVTSKDGVTVWRQSFTFLCEQLSNNIEKCFLRKNVFSAHFAISLLCLHNIKT